MGNSNSNSNQHIKKYFFKISKTHGVYIFNETDLCGHKFIEREPSKEALSYVTVIYGSDEFNYGVSSLNDVKDLCKIHDSCDKMYLMFITNSLLGDDEHNGLTHYTDVKRYDSNNILTGLGIDKNKHVFYPRLY